MAAMEVLRFRHNAMEILSIAEFENIRGGINRNCKDVYFVRALGVNASLVKDITEMDRVFTQSVQQGRCAYSRIKELPKMTAVEDADYYAGCYANWLNKDRTEMATKTTLEDEAMRRLLGRACTDVLPYLKEGNALVSGSMEKNFIIKVIYWFDWLAKDLHLRWTENLTIKVVAFNIVKKQEYLFFYFLTLLGFDVMLIQNEQDIDAKLDAFGLSKKFDLGNFARISIPEFDKTRIVVSLEQSPAAVHNNLRASAISQPAKGDAETAQQNGENASGIPIRVHIPERVRPNRGIRVQSAAGAQPGQNTQTQSPSGTQSGRNMQMQFPSGTQSGRNMPLQSGAVHTQRGQSSASLQPRAEKTFEELARLASSVVMIAIHDNRGEVVGTGSGIMVGREGFILTNNHVASGGYSYSVRIEEDEQIYQTDEMIKYNPVLDLAVIRIQRQLKPLPVYQGSQPLVRGQKVVAIGSPLGMFNSVSDGIISGFRKIDSVDMIQFTAPTSRGSSGGAVLNMYGEVIGISTAGIADGQNINLAMGYECINAFVRGFV